MEPEVDITFIKPGYVLLYRSEHLLSRLIRYFQKCPYHHAGIVVELWGELFVAESNRKGLTVNKLEDSIKGYQNLILPPKFDYDPIRINKFVIPLLGKHKYDTMSLIFYQLIFLLTKKWIGRRDEHACKRLYCSEFVAYVFHSLYDIFGQWYLTNPKLIYDNPNFEHYKLIRRS